MRHFCKKILPLASFFCFSLSILQAQTWFDDFSDGNLTNNPVWQGDIGNFIVTPEGQLRLMAPDAGASILYSAVTFPDSTVWDGFALLDFAPSSANLTRFYLQSSSTDLLNANGYYLRMGVDGSADALELYRQDAGASTLLLSCTPAAVSLQPAQAIWHVVRSATGQWSISADYNLGGGVINEGSVTDNTYPASSGLYTGLYCLYSATRKDKFYYDNLSVSGFSAPDATAPTLLSAQATWPNSLLFEFSEAIDPADVVVGNFTINGVAANTVQLNAANQVLATSNFVQGTNTYDVQNVSDAIGNVMLPSNGSFVVFPEQPALPEDIIITEIMADPSPQVGLPDAEYFEIYNRATYAIRLNTLQVSAGSTPQTLPNILLPPGAYALVCDDGVASSFSDASYVAFVATMPALTNSGDTIIITNLTGQQIAIQVYNTDFYGDVAFADGGYSMERKSTDLPCRIDAAIWGASIHAAGGTPGNVNSISSVEEIPFLPISLDILTPTTLLLTFNRRLALSSLDPVFYLQQPQNVLVSGVAFANNWQNQLLLTLPVAITNDSATIFINGVGDCSFPIVSGAATINTWDNDIQPISPYSVLINEIMADPTPVVGLVDAEWIELYNGSNQTIDLSACTLKSGTTVSTAFPQPTLLEPGAFLVVSEQTLPSSIFGNTLILNIPELSNSGDDIGLYDSYGQLIDIVFYTSGTYGDNNKAEGGWSLERINPLAPCQGSENWMATTDLSGGTPGRVNSVLEMTNDTQGPRMLAAFPNNDTEVLVFFDEALMWADINISQFSINPSVDISSIVAFDAQQRTGKILLSTPLQNGILYTLQMQADVADCLGNNSLFTQTVPLGLPEAPMAGDLVLNEILADPETGGSRFIEIYNNSNKVIALQGLIIGAIRPDGTDLRPIEQAALIFPDSFAVLADVREDILQRFAVPSPASLYTHDLPSWDVKLDNATLYSVQDGQNVVLDSFTYEKSWHNALLSSVSGVSLERLQFEGPSTSAANWQSASSTADFGTPTGPNSQKATFPNADTTELIYLADPVFSPDNDGYRDQLLVELRPSAANGVATVQIYSMQGYLVHTLVPKASLGAYNVWQWDGQTDEGDRARIGIYIIVADTVYPDGKRERQKTTCTLGGKG